MNTLLDLETLLDDRVERADLPVLRGDDLLARARRSRTTHRMQVAGLAAGVATAVAAVSLIAVPTLRGAGDDVSPQRPAVAAPAWVASLPGQTLPLGDAPTVTYAVGNKLHVGSKVVTLQGDIERLVTIPEGYLATIGDAGVSADFAGANEALVLVTPDGAITELQGGSVTGFAARLRPGAGTQVAWATNGFASAGPTELKLVTIGEDSTTVSAAGARTIVAGFDGADPIVMQLGSGSGVTLRWDVAAGTLVPSQWELPESAAADGSFAIYNVGTGGCVDAVRASDPGQVAWHACGQRTWGLVSPDGAVVAGSSVLSAATGVVERALDIGLPADYADNFDYLIVVNAEGWESDTSLLVTVERIESIMEDGVSVGSKQTAVSLRCDVTTGDCERLPGGVDAVAVPPLAPNLPAPPAS